MKLLNYSWEQWLDARWRYFLGAGILVNLTGLFFTIIEPDGAVYATLAKQMVLTGDYGNLILQGRDWLDKPHFPFWMIALSYHIFGITTFAYKLPALLFWALGGWYTFRFANLFYTRTVAQISVLIYLTAMHAVLSNNDVRAEPYLMGLIIGSVFHLYRASQQKFGLDLILGTLLAACAIMTKGIFVISTIGIGLLIHWSWKKEWLTLFHWRWLLAIVLILVFITPELFSLYQQFDLHPEKIVFGKTGVSGIRFFFWDSQFGRFFNTGPIQGEGDKFFFLHTTLWAFFPSSILFFGAIFAAVKTKFKQIPELITIGNTVFTFLLFSFSGFQLPHYMNIIFPFMSILSAFYLCEMVTYTKNVFWRGLFYFQSVLAFTAAIALTIWFQPELLFLAIGWILISLLIVVKLSDKSMTLQTAFGRTVAASCMLYVYLAFFFTRDLVHYQSGSEAAFYVNQKYPTRTVAMIEGDNSYSFDFYYREIVTYYSVEQLLKMNNKLLFFCSEGLLKKLSDTGIHYQILQTFSNYHISQPQGDFMNAATRKGTLSKSHLLQLN
ncbi:MAG: ArnT family glycosyltransferase [Cyclobacteriaceae bacterium]|jgi:4-amino-4-deoxy-L-arabinose transferase-like glycosyltransferase|nr:glycosyltransferase family 39 protein [Flammeovirgaceae bacterium]